jgi:PAS domain S-box-containing protein
MHIEPEGEQLDQLQAELARLSRELQESKERLAVVQQAANIGIFDWHIPSGVIVWTTEAEALYGLPAGSFGGSFADWERCVHPDDLPTARASVLESVKKKFNLDIQFRVIWPEDQSVHWLYTKGCTFYDVQGQPLHMLGINIDITDRKMYEEELRIREEKLRLFAESDIIGLIFTTIFGDISYANDAFLQITGYNREDINQGVVRWTDITPPEWLEMERAKIEEVQQTGTPALYEKQYIHKNGHLIDVLVGYLLCGEKREQAVAFVLDITERKRLERQKDEFIGVASHELRTPVTSLKVFAQLLQKRFLKAGDEQNAALLAKMGVQINKLARLIEDLIDITRIETGQLHLHFVQFDIAPLISEVVEEMQRTTEQHTLITEHLSPAFVEGDRERVAQVLTNLLSNAIKYSPQADSILIRMSSDDHQVTVSVQDRGMGIPREKQQQIFQRFYRVEGKDIETISGMGLGLYISAEMIKQQGGTIHFESTPGDGSTFCISLPRARETTPSPEEHEEEYGQKSFDCG